MAQGGKGRQKGQAAGGRQVYRRGQGTVGATPHAMSTGGTKAKATPSRTPFDYDACLTSEPSHAKAHSGRRTAPAPAGAQNHSNAAPGRRPPRVAVAVAAMGLALLVVLTGVFGLSRLFGGTPPTAAAAKGAQGQRIFAPADGRLVVLLDAGHGGQDGGTTGAGLVEKDLTLDMAYRVGALLARHEDELLVVYTREDDSYLTPKQRGEISAAVGANLLLSLHLNADEYSPNVRGFQVFAQPPKHSQHEASLVAARLLVDKIPALGLPTLGDTGVYYMFYRSEYDKAPYDSSWHIPEDELLNDTFGVLEFASCPALLVEQWYLSNDADLALMHNEAGLNAMARILYETTCEFLGLTAL